MESSFLEDYLWLRGRLSIDDEDEESAAQDVRQFRTILNDTQGPFGRIQLANIRQLFKDQTDPAVRLELGDVLVHMGDPFVRRQFPNCLSDVDRDKLVVFLRELDGHDLYTPAMIQELGFSKQFVEALTFECMGYFLDKKGGTKMTRKAVISGYHFVLFLGHQLNLRPKHFLNGRGSHTGEFVPLIIENVLSNPPPTGS